MSSRHGYGAPPASMPRSVQVLIGLLAVVAVGGTAAFAVTFKSVSDKGEPGVGAAAAATATNCDNPETVPVAADPSIASALEAVAAAIPAADLGCMSLRVTPQDPALTVAAIADGTAPGLWIPDSSEWLDKVSASGREIRRISSSVASTPVVTVSAPGSEAPGAWTDVLGAPALHIGDPLTSAVSSAPIVAAFAETQSRGGDLTSISAALVPVAQAQYGNLKETGSTGRIQTVDADGGTAVTTEQTFEAYLAAHADSGLAASVPTSGSVFMDYPMASMGADSSTDEAGKLLAAALTSDTGRSVLAGLGFRGADQAPLVAGGVGKVVSLVPSDPAVVTKALARYEILSRPSRALAVVDVSGSMDYMQDGITRMAATAQAGDIAIRMFPANAQLGLWAFSVDLGDGTDYRELEPIARMDATEGETDHRSKLLSQIDNLSSIVGGGTGLYDSVLAAYRSVQQSYDPASINSVILLTDGANDDPAGISLQELLDTLTREQDPTRPVPIITIGVTDDADTDVLEQISALTGGNSHFAPTPADIPKVFVGAISGRAG
ncbi:substrate-binding domain-containing protein [Rhodococcus sp. NPDC056506]|uniref:substrate-binding domain-containing protein n=1 Tax=Rhodococcus sp. NPDC056506 TaxID=3345844 RepID=UPI00366DC68D